MKTLDTTHEVAALFAKCLSVYLKQSDKIQEGVREMTEIVQSPETDEDEKFRAINTIAECLACDASDE